MDVSSIGSVADHRDAERLEVRAEREVVVLVPREARQIEHDHEMHAALVQPAVRQQVLKLAAIRGLGAPAFLVKAFEDLTLGAPRCDLAPGRTGGPRRSCGRPSRLGARLTRA